MCLFTKEFDSLPLKRLKKTAEKDANCFNWRWFLYEMGLEYRKLTNDWAYEISEKLNLVCFGFVVFYTKKLVLKTLSIRKVEKTLNSSPKRCPTKIIRKPFIQKTRKTGIDAKFPTFTQPLLNRILLEVFVFRESDNRRVGTK